MLQGPATHLLASSCCAHSACMRLPPPGERAGGERGGDLWRSCGDGLTTCTACHSTPPLVLPPLLLLARPSRLEAPGLGLPGPELVAAAAEGERAAAAAGSANRASTDTKVCDRV